MTPKIINNASEPILKESILPILIKSGFNYEFFKRMRSFYIRNVIVFEKDEKNINKGICCTQCLKAHALHLAKQLDFPSDVIENIHNLLDCETGHNGYYLDEDELIEI